MSKPITWGQLIILIIVVFALFVLWTNFGGKLTGPHKPAGVVNSNPDYIEEPQPDGSIIYRDRASGKIMVIGRKVTK